MFFVRYFILGIAIFIIFIGLLSFSFGIICASGFVDIGSFEFPLGDPTGIIMNRHGEIFCSLQFYQRVQVYDRSGKFLRSWQVPTINSFVLGLDENDSVVVESGDSIRYFYDSTGNKLSQIAANILAPPDIGSIIATEIRYAKDFCFDPEGNRYEIYNRLIYPRIQKISPQGKHSIVIEAPFYYLFITGPIWPWFEILFGFILLAIVQILQEKIPTLQRIYIVDSQKKKNASTGDDAIMVSLPIYLLLEPFGIIIGSIVAIGIILYFHNLRELTFIKVSLTVFSVIVGIHVFLHSVFSPMCSLCNSKTSLHKVSDKPVQYRCKNCGNIYTQNTID